MQSISPFVGCCPKNEYVNSRFITLAKGQSETITIQAKAPSKSSIDNCNTNLISAWTDDKGYTALVQVFENCAGSGNTINIKDYETKPISVQCVSSTESCNQKDDDCDGSIDEEYVCGGSPPVVTTGCPEGKVCCSKVGSQLGKIDYYCDSWCLWDIPDERCNNITITPCTENCNLDDSCNSKCGIGNCQADPDCAVIVPNETIIEDPKQHALPWDEWKDASPGMKLKTVCSTNDNCADYKSLTNKNYTVSCEQTQNIITELELASDDACKTSLWKKITTSTSLVTGLGCGTTITLMVLCSVPSGGLCTAALAPLSLVTCGASASTAVATLTGCAIWAQPDLSKGACIAIPTEGESEGFCFDFANDMLKGITKQSNCTTNSVIFIIIAFVMFMVFISFLPKR